MYTFRDVSSRIIILSIIAPIVAGNGTQLIDWYSLSDPVSKGDDSQIQLILYNRKYKEGTTDMSHVKKKLPTYILIHGFNDNLKESIMLPLLTKSYLDRERCNVVVVDWSEHAKGPWFINAAKNTLFVGKELARWLDMSGLDMKRVTLVGFSMGAHVAGDAGYFSKNRVKRIVALDPAHFLFQSSPAEFRLDSSDAEIVEVVHTSGGYIGEKESMGTRDFFPNGGGYPQPGCSPDPTGICSHRRAYYYYNEAIAHPDDNFRGHRCESYEHFVKHKCKEKGKPVILHLVNTNLDKRFTGNFYFVTNSKEPYLKRNVSSSKPTTTLSEKSREPPKTNRVTTEEYQPSTVKRRSTTYDLQQVITDVMKDKSRASMPAKYQKMALEKLFPLTTERRMWEKQRTTAEKRASQRDLHSSSSTDKVKTWKDKLWLFTTERPRFVANLNDADKYR